MHAWLALLRAVTNIESLMATLTELTPLDFFAASLKRRRIFLSRKERQIEPSRCNTSNSLVVDMFDLSCPIRFFWSDKSP